MHGLGHRLFVMQDGKWYGLDKNGHNAEGTRCSEENESAPEVFPAHPVEEKEGLIHEKDAPVPCSRRIVGVLGHEFRGGGKEPGAQRHQGEVEQRDFRGQLPVAEAQTHG